MTEKNRLYFADCLKILRNIYKENPQGIFDLIYIDPPFNSKRNYNVLFEDIDKIDATAQKEAFKDTWSSVSYVDTINEIQDLSLDLYDYLKVLDKINISQSTVSYLTTMAVRIYYIHKVLKDTGSFYLHCDPTMSHYLKTVCDLIFGYRNFRNEIIWKRMTPSGFKGKKDLGTSHDVILRYSSTVDFTYNPIMIPYTNDYIKKYFSKIDENRRIFKDEKIGTATSDKTIKKLEQEGKIYITKKGKLRIKHYLDEAEGFPIDDVWLDLPPINSQAKELLGYPTQKPETLLERIIKASSNKGDLVGDFFCGCGTTVAVSQKLNRRWLGVDISHLAIGLIRKRLLAPHTKQEQKKILADIQIDGFPKDLASAKELAENVDKGRLLFQDWIIEVMLNGVSNPKKTADGGFDGYLSFTLKSQKQLALIEVKSGKVGVKNMREFIQVVRKREAAIGVFVCFSEYVTKGMEKEAKECGYYNEELFNKRHPKIQILTVDQILKGELINMPMVFETTFKQASKSELKPDGEQKSF